MVTALESTERAAAVGPLSNAATHQSVPAMLDRSGGWSTNQLPANWTPADMYKLVQHLSDDKLVEMKILGGFFIVYRSEIFKEVGMFDEKVSPMGYGEEVDFALRVQQTNKTMFVHPSIYIYHVKGKSFGETARQKLIKTTKGNLEAKYDGFNHLIQEMRLKDVLSQKRKQLQCFMNDHSLKILQHEISVLFLLNPMGNMPTFTLRGGWVSLVQEVVGMQYNGIHAKLAIPRKLLAAFQSSFTEGSRLDIFLPYESTNPTKLTREFLDLCLPFTFFVASYWTTIGTSLSLTSSVPNSIPALFAQDIESRFPGSSGADHEYLEMSERGFVFVKTRYLQDELMKMGIRALKIRPTSDKTLFKAVERDFSGNMHICAMYRQETPRRQPLQTLQILTNISKRYESSVQITVFGTPAGQTQQPWPPLITNLGVIGTKQSAELYSRCHIFLDFSSWQAFGRSGLDFMSTGGIAILPQNGGVTEYAVHERNSFVIDSSSISSALNILEDILDGQYNLTRISKCAIKDTQKFDIKQASKYNSRIFQQMKKLWENGLHPLP